MHRPGSDFTEGAKFNEFTASGAIIYGTHDYSATAIVAQFRAA